MRLWHKDLIPYLPRQQLLGQWRECCCIAKSIAEKGTPNHILVNKIMDYPIEHFIRYAMYVQWYMLNRGYKLEFEKFTKYFDFAYEDYEKILTIPLEEIFTKWHNDRYLNQCLCNLQEKYDCGGIHEEEWLVIANRFDEEMRFCP